MGERDQKAPVDTSRRLDELETGLQNVRGRLDGLERSNRAISTDVRAMKDQINSMQSSIQEMLMIFRNLSEKIKQQGAGSRQMETAGAGGRVPGTGSKKTADGAGGRRERAGEGDEIVRDPRHLREDEDEGA